MSAQTEGVLYDVVVRGGRVIDPASGIDAVTDVGLTDGRVAALGSGLRGRTELDAAGCVVAPGFIDLHNHAQDLAGHRLAAMDGVTTALDLESGVAPTGTVYAAAAAEGRPLNYGYSAPWAAARLQVLADVPRDGTIGTMLAHIGDPRWQRPAQPREVQQILDLLQEDLAGGALGIGVIVGYAQTTDPSEYLAVAAVAAEHGVPTYTHARDLIDTSPEVLVDGAEELVRAAGETGAHMHYCHVNSTSFRHVDRVLSLIDRVRGEGSRVTTEAYPYGAGMTGIGAEFLAPERLRARGMTPQSLVYAPTGERIADEARLRELRDKDPGGLVIVHMLDETRPADLQLLLRSLAFTDACIASDAMPLTWQGEPAPDAWPLPPTAFTHPRAAGTFSKAFRLMVTEHAVIDIPEFVRRASCLPAAVVELATKGAVRKGTLAVGTDADIVVFDPAGYRDQATYEACTRPSSGLRHLLVAAAPVVRDGELQLDARPGQPVRGAHC
ncbi:MAG: amidohydrolase family protein [Frankiaceae bacterium]|nr:amidohydrolase family protein [Frankiaceae bacterium]